MIVLPAIDILGGKAVRLYKGDYNSVTTYNDDPIDQAQRFKEMGIQRLHIVDLDAAKGLANNRAIIKSIIQKTGLEVELGGGIRNIPDVKELLDIGVQFLIIGTALVKDPESVETWVKVNPKAFIAGIDAYDGEVKTAGWLQESGLKDTDLGHRARELGFKTIIYTNISKDGTLEGPDFDRTVNMAQTSKLGVILSGGISSIEDIRKAKSLEDKGIIGFISGKAMYENKFDLKEAIEICKP